MLACRPRLSEFLKLRYIGEPTASAVRADSRMGTESTAAGNRLSLLQRSMPDCACGCPAERHSCFAPAVESPVGSSVESRHSSRSRDIGLRVRGSGTQTDRVRDGTGSRLHGAFTRRPIVHSDTPHESVVSIGPCRSITASGFVGQLRGNRVCAAVYPISIDFGPSFLCHRERLGLDENAAGDRHRYRRG